jgi:hypothetical protein
MKNALLISSVVGGNDTAGVNDAGKVPQAGKNDRQEEFDRTAVLPKNADWREEESTGQSTALVAASGGAIGI